MSGPKPHMMEIEVEVWRMPPRPRHGASYTTDALKECHAIVKWLNSLPPLGYEPASFSNRPFDAPVASSPYAKPGPCIMIGAQYSVWRADPGDYIVFRPETFDKRIEVVKRADFMKRFTMS